MADADPATMPKKRGRPPKVKPEAASAAPPPVELPQAKTKLTAGALRAALKDVLGAVEARGTIPILSHVLIQAEGHALHLTGTDLDLWVARDLATEPEAGWRGFVTCVPAKPLEQLLGVIEADCPVTMTLEENRLAVKAGRSRWHLQVLPPDDFPRMPDLPAQFVFDMTCAALADAFAAVDHAISTEETRYYLNGVLVHVVDGALIFAATDGNRLARWSAPLPDGGESFPAQIVPRRAVGLLGRLLTAALKTGSESDPARVLVECASERPGALLRWSLPAADGGEVVITAKSIDGTFPDYPRVIPHEPPLTATLGRGALAAGVRRVAVLAESKSRAVRVLCEQDKVTLSVVTPGLGDAEVELPAMYEGDPFTVGFNADFLLDALAAIATDEVVLRFAADSVGPVLLLPSRADNETPRLLQVLMPMRV